MLAHRIERYILQDHHLIMSEFKTHLQVILRVFAYTHKEFGIHLRYTCRGLDNPLTPGVFAYGIKNISYGLLNFGLIKHNPSPRR